uniref:Rad60/SUMO-like domain-containing protein n=1 Tax=Rhinopithecus roxellana TaxID=61622 RepID=A0A2K6RLS8_RHIRO
MANEKPKEGVKTENNDHINLKVAGQDVSVVQFKIKRHIPLSKLTKAYYTPAQLEMEDEDATDLFQQQVGGVH